MKLDIFKAYDIRGKFKDALTPKVAEQIGRAFATWLPAAGAIVVARDMRQDSTELTEAFVAGILQQGRDVWDLDLATTDMVNFTVGRFNLAGGAMITSSHEPGAFNVIKLCRDQAKPVGVDDGFTEIRDMVARSEFVATPNLGQLTSKHVLGDWLAHVLGFANTSAWPEYKIAIDTGSGMAGMVMPQFIKKVPLRAEPMYFDLSGDYPYHPAEPNNPNNLVDIQNKIKADNCDLGVAFDSDGDAAVLLDENGEALSGSILTAILAKYLLKKYPKSVVLYSIICSQAVKEAIKEAGGKPTRTKVGQSYIKADMRRLKAIFGGEHSGHYYFKDNFYSDSGLVALVLTIQAMSETGKKLSELAADFKFRYLSIAETNFKVEDRLGAIEKVRASFSDGDQDLLDGLTIRWSNKWFNVRPANTEPLLRLNAEAKTQAELEELVARVTAIIKPFISA